MADSAITFWQFMNQLREKSYGHLDSLTVLRQAREQGILITLDDVRRLAALQRHEGFFLCGSFIPEFITAYLRHTPIHSILDPFAGVGGFIGQVVQAPTLDIERAIGLETNPREAELACIIHESARVDWRVGNPSELLSQMTEPFDAIIGCPHLGMPTASRTLDYKGHEFTLHDESGRIIAAEALRLLGTNGVALFVVTPNFLWHHELHPHSLSAQLEQLGVYLDAALLIRQGAFVPQSRLPGLLVILKREKPDRVFVGELDAEVARNGALLNNLLTRKRGKAPQLGSLIERTNLTSVEAVFTEYEIKRQVQKMNVDAVPLADVAIEINRLSAHRPGEFEAKPNSVYLPLIASSNAVSSLDDLKLKPHHYAQLVLDPERANAHYVADFLNTPLGLLTRESLASSVTISRDTKRTLGEALLYLPDLTTQERVLGIQTRLTKIQTEVDQLRRKLAEHPHSFPSVAEAITKWEQTSEHDDIAWYETLPFPLASILWAYHADNNVEHRVDYLFHFFEAFAEYRATVLLSAFASDNAIYSEYCKAWISDEPKYRDKYKQADFGYWNELGACLAKTTRELLGDEKTKQVCLALFGQTDSTYVEMISDKRFVQPLDEAREYRNRWKGHGGLANQREHQQRLDTLEQLLAMIYSVISDRHKSIRLIAPEVCEFTEGVYRYNAKNIMGTHIPFPTVRVETLVPMDSKDLYLLPEGGAHPLRLLPFIRLTAAPKTQRTACYFYSSMQSGDEVRLVSYQFEGESELIRTDSRLVSALQFLSPERIQDDSFA